MRDQESSMPERLKFDLAFGRPGRRRDDAEPMRLLLLGDFRGSAVSERPPLARRPTQQVDIDTLDDVLQRLGPRLDLAAGEIRFRQIDDFHPDQLYARLDLFQALRNKRAKPPEDLDDLFGRLLGRETQSSTAPAPASGLDALIHKVVASHIVKDTSAQTQAYGAAVDAAIAEQMRSLLHDAAFQSLEAAWRGVHWLISSLELDENLQLHLLDVSRAELLADIVAAKGQLTETGLYQALVDRWRNVPGAPGWSAFIVLDRFGPSDADIGLLAALGLIASQAGGPLLGDANLALSGDDDVALAGWRALRRSEAAPWIALAAPRVLLRLPYGKRSDPVESFAFEEFPGPPAHEEFLWGHASLAMALLIGRGFTARGWTMELGDEREIGDLPAFTFTRNGEQEMQACGERFLTEGEIQKLIDAGLVAIASRRDRNAVVAIRFQSISEPPAPLVW
jgi:type VI secretion system protein ImpC